MCMVRSPKSIGGVVGLALGNAPYKIAFGIALPFYVKSQITEAIPVRVALHFINLSGSSVIVMQWTGVIRDGTLI
ncbi:hypothetical protein MiTe_02433 [Microcystis aeruginosa NIES-2520]|jgi:hypothetical protein|uniref:Uncharacterized protein n=1 Tax=Microcystis aeruginosa NIES-2520 TaxID=2303982 RepID=A0A5A5RQZ3_MICAE|nr:hypothetical protein MiTe_02433 [Microcystis aeruginosa NIES-2520]